MPDDALLFLDLSTKVGWAVGSYSSLPRPVAWGTWRLPQNGILDGRVYCAFAERLAECLQSDESIARIYVEAPIPHAGLQQDASIIEMQLSLVGISRMIARRYDMPPVQTSHVRTIRSRILGKNPPAGQAKATCIAWCRERGMAVEDDGQADAIIGWLWAASYESKRGNARQGVLIG